MHQLNDCFAKKGDNVRRQKFTPEVTSLVKMGKRVKRGISSCHHNYTVDSRYLEVQGTLWNISRFPYIDISDMQNLVKSKSNSHISQLSPEVRDILKILWTIGDIAPEERFLFFFFHNI